MLGIAPPEVQRPKQQPSVPVQRPKAMTEPEDPDPPAEEAPALEEPATPAPEEPAVSSSDRAAEKAEFAELLGPLADDEPPAPVEPVEVEDRPPQPRPAPIDIVREGVTIAVGVGATLCGHDWCDPYRGGLGGQLELGLRVRRFMPHVSVDGGGGSDDRSTLEDQLQIPHGSLASARTSFFGVGAGMSLFFRLVGRFDPYVTARLGYTRTRSRFVNRGGRRFAETVARGSVRLGGGFDVFIGSFLSLGPRFDVTVGFAGEVCVEQFDAGPSKECFDTRNLENEVRIYARDLPLPIFVGAQIRVVIPVRLRAR